MKIGRYEIGPKAYELMLKFECDGRAGYSPHLEWPGDASGITGGIGYDFGYDKMWRDDWAGRLDDATLGRIARVAGLRGEAAHRALASVRDIAIPWKDAEEVYQQCTLPTYIAQTIDVFPGSETLPPEAFGALVSLVFNRGPLVNQSDRRREMLAIHQIFLHGPPFDLSAIAAQVESMKRLWADVPRSDNDLHDRRVSEANLIRSAIA